jgi:hypothetical protein
VSGSAEAAGKEPSAFRVSRQSAIRSCWIVPHILQAIIQAPLASDTRQHPAHADTSELEPSASAAPTAAPVAASAGGASSDASPSTSDLVLDLGACFGIALDDDIGFNAVAAAAVSRTSHSLKSRLRLRTEELNGGTSKIIPSDLDLLLLAIMSYGSGVEKVIKRGDEGCGETVAKVGLQVTGQGPLLGSFFKALAASLAASLAYTSSFSTSLNPPSASPDVTASDEQEVDVKSPTGLIQGGVMNITSVLLNRHLLWLVICIQVCMYIVSAVFEDHVLGMWRDKSMKV